MRYKRVWDAWVLAALVFLIGILNIVSSISPSLPARLHILEDVLPLIMVQGSRHIVVLTGLLLVLTSRGILRRKRMAWWAAFVMISASVVLQLLKGLDYEEAAISAMVLAVMIALFPRFQAKSDAPTVRQALRMFVVIIVFDILYGVLGFSLLFKNFRLSPEFMVYLRETLTVMFTSRVDVAIPTTRHARWFLSSLWFLWEAGLVLFMFMLLKPVIYRSGQWGREREKAATIASLYGRSSLVYFTLWEDKLFYFNSRETAYIAYRQVGDVAVALGDPVGPKEDLPETIAGFIDFCFTNGWQPAFYQVLPENLHVYRDLGMRCLHIGDEAIVDLKTFDMAGKRYKALRNNMHRMEKEGYSAVWHKPPLGEDLIWRLRQVSNDWLKYQGGDEKAFSLGWFEPRMIRHTEVITVEDASGRIYAFANHIPMYTLSQASPDLMRYAREAPTGTMDYLFVKSMLHYKEEGLNGYNLGLAPLAHVGREESSPLTEKAVRLLYNNFYNFKGLYRFKAKYHPHWEPRFLIYPNLVALPRIALAVVRAGNPTGFAKFWRWLVVRLGQKKGW